jgi:altronate dehydratase
MDSAGNDPESIAGQVASGCNLVFFVTGNGSVTNFPFVPTVKVMTTSGRYDLLSGEMDVNAGAYLDGTPMEQLAGETLELALEVASGERTKGEKASHAQASFWRDWGGTETRRPRILDAMPQRPGTPIPIRTDGERGRLSFRAIRTENGHAVDRVGVIFPASLCSSQVARMGAERFTRKGLGREQGISRFVALVHTEGCGMAGDSAERVYAHTMLAYLTHPLVDGCALLEHGCENTHNDYIRRRLEGFGVNPEGFGWASIQLDGGIEKALRKLEDWFAARLSRRGVPDYEEANLSALCVGVLTAGPVDRSAAEGLAGFTRTIVGAGGTVVVPYDDGLLESPTFQEMTLGRLEPSLTYAQPARAFGFHVMDTPTDHLVETLTGLGATGAQILVACAGEHPVQGHPLVPTLLVGGTEAVRQGFGADLDCALGRTASENTEDLLRKVLAVASRDCIPNSRTHGNTDFQLPRSWLGFSM